MARILSRRLQCVLELIRPCAVLADVGTDHALLPVAAVRSGIAERAIAADLREAPLRGARAHIERSGVADRVLAVKGDGLLALEHLEAQAVVIAGMSGESMLRLLDAAPALLARLGQLILQPNQNVHLVRAWALRNGWHLTDERMLEEHGRFFVVCAFAPAPGEDPAYSVPGWSEAALCSIGPWLLARRDSVALRWFERQRTRVAHWVGQAACQAMRAVGGQIPADSTKTVPGSA
jgi:tRNA (adenine22-N1)-methyltransferase